MKVLVSAVALRGSGSRILGESLVAALDRHGDVDQTAWVPRDWSRVPSKVHRIAPGFGPKLLHELSIPSRSRMFDAVLSLGDTGTPIPRRPHVLLVQQAHLAYPADEWGYRPPRRFRTKMLALEAYFRAGMAGVTRFTVQTEDMKQQLSARWDLPSERIDVIPSSVLPVPIHEPLKSSRPFISCVTSAGPHKNLSVLPELLATLSDDVDLRITVASHEVPELVARCRRLRVFDRVVFEGAVTRERAMSLLASSECAVLPSLLESFGFGFYEAMAVGTPVVAADRGFAREACGEAARYADPSSGEDFGRAVNATLRASRERQAEASRARFAHVARTWDQIAESYVASIRRAVQP